ncbi:hypothetical protein L1887_48441 [Cichorium endivia]|nr:hypothetical protein L1887_48441 [Cichorium endivia]
MGIFCCGGFGPRIAPPTAGRLEGTAVDAEGAGGALGLCGLCRLDDLVVEHVERCAEHDPLDHVLVALAERLPHGLFLGRLSCDGHTRSTATTASCRGVLLDLAKLDALWWDEMAGVGKVEHGPPGCVRVGFRDLEERLFVSGRVWIGEREFVYGRVDARVGDGPFEVARCLAAHRLVRMAVGVAAVGGAAAGTARAGGRHHLGDAEVALRRGG